MDSHLQFHASSSKSSSLFMPENEDETHKNLMNDAENYENK